VNREVADDGPPSDHGMLTSSTRQQMRSIPMSLAYSDRVRALLWTAGTVAGLMFSACDESPASPSGSGAPTLRVVFMGSTSRRTDMPASADACVAGVGFTHIHPSWRGFAAYALQPVPPDRYEIAFDDVPVGTPISFRVNDQNSCDQNATGAVTRNVFANDVRLTQNTTTPGNGEEPGYALTMAANGAIRQ
jgi:hypothetical protein